MTILSLSLQLKKDNADIVTAIDTATNTIKNYADVQDFVNIRPTIGINGETQIAITTTGLIAKIPKTIIFLGGYCSTLPYTEVSLRPNGVNYIYISRDKNDRHKLNIENRDMVIGVEGETAFDRIMPAKIVTNNTAASNTVLYDIG